MPENNESESVHIHPPVVISKSIVDEPPTATDPGCDCPVPVKPMADWLVGTPESDPDECRPCALPPVVQWYESELRERGDSAVADELKAVIEEGDPNQICIKLDQIKSAVGEDTRKRLLEFDCTIQAQDLSALKEPFSDEA